MLLRRNFFDHFSASFGSIFIIGGMLKRGVLAWESFFLYNIYRGWMFLVGYRNCYFIHMLFRFLKFPGLACMCTITVASRFGGFFLIFLLVDCEHVVMNFN